MTARDEVERLLAEHLRDWRLSGCNCNPLTDGQTCSPCLRDRLLASDWLAAHDAEVRADERRRVLAEVEREIGALHGFLVPAPTTFPDALAAANAHARTHARTDIASHLALRDDHPASDRRWETPLPHDLEPPC